MAGKILIPLIDQYLKQGIGSLRLNNQPWWGAGGGCSRMFHSFKTGGRYIIYIDGFALKPHSSHVIGEIYRHGDSA